MASFGIGQAVRRVEDRRFLTGRGSYVDDIELPRQCHAVAVLSTHAHARIKRIDVAAARAAPGVALVLTGVDALAEDIGGIPPHFMPEHWGGPKGFGTLRPVLLADRVRCVGDRVAFVVAETEAQARDAAELVEVEYEPLPAVISLEDAVKPSAPKIWEDCPSGNSRRDHQLRRQGGDRCRLHESQVCRCAAAREQSGDRQRDRAALRDRRRQRRSLHALLDVAGSARAPQQARGGNSPRSRNEDPRRSRQTSAVASA